MEFKLLKRKNFIIYVFLSLGDDSSNFLLLFSNCHESTHSVLGVFCSIFLHWVIKLTQKYIIAFS